MHSTLDRLGRYCGSSFIEPWLALTLEVIRSRNIFAYVDSGLVCSVSRANRLSCSFEDIEMKSPADVGNANCLMWSFCRCRAAKSSRFRKLEGRLGEQIS